MHVYFLFLESLGTPELILIAFVALIVFGPRKLPTIGRTIGKYTAEFKRASREFRDTWEREVQQAEDVEKNNLTKNFGEINPNAATAEEFKAVENTIGRNSMRRAAASEESFTALNENNSVALPEIRAVTQPEFVDSAIVSQTDAEIIESVEIAQTIETPMRKREWL